MRWKVAPRKSDDLVEQLLINRGINTVEDKEQFFHPKLEDFGGDLKIPGIPKVAKRILQSVEKDELVVVYGDYDADGICAAAILYKALTSIGARVLPYIPHREKEGYGLSRLGLEFARDSGASLVITVDNGIVAVDQAKFAKEIGLDLIITDHHVPGKKKPDAFEIVHSTKMCGAAVAWCLIRDLIKKELAVELLQFVAIATVCDLLPLVRLGRAFVFEGLKILNKTENPGLLALINECGIRSGSIGSFEIGYMIGPRLNAMGRLEHAIDSLRLLCTKDPLKAKRLAKLLCETNATRQKMTMEAIEQAKLLVDRSKKIHVLSSKDWSSGIIGLVAGKITEEHYRPAIAISVGEEVSKGSARSIDGINIIEVIRKHSDILIDVGGHPGAAGFSLLSKHVEVFKKRLEEHIIVLPEEGRVLEIEAEVSGKQLTKALVSELKKFEPFGMDNKRPVFATRGMRISDIRTVGEGKHLKGRADDLDFIAFGMGEWVNLLKSGQIIDLAYNLELDTYNGNDKLQLKVKDIKIT
ncbi:single-stranded-DNA-specific exonuclease RecJ [Candidatus Daviesbacteria bacterium RIFCSPHIGHO2_01_FULL_40_11]|uniref:Single-stranded-DNA-specific exonuclease RecJ n=1 Tax=Candidatus Daviesbacteria bacterium RIFCSPHIGHO2_01_FULL_40_11 TaxID=1797762 RepID=A0A1F5JL25_9BACT|nr:MAG: single-stranded-DNA-specific exonuclease RecJ [Candidatus Daviesbacteria bacterium RIFCSPHIGHO2_01_FULL_40_11]OGE63048.1 MAG: single-stranded-DNA-specific exonuclease RecJ [Candidatus Daviesbacteria bacterium RIFCSPLOWO2_01_FULL_40_27]